jgi:hypothetical protein
MGEPAPYLHLARTFDLVEQESGRLRTVDMLCNMFRRCASILYYQILGLQISMSMSRDWVTYLCDQFLDVHFVHLIRFSKCFSWFDSSRMKCIQVFSITFMTLYTFTCKCLVTCSTDFVYIFCLYSLLALSPEDVLPAIYLATNGIAPGFENTVSLSWHIC